MDDEKKLRIERTIPTKGYESEEYSISDALVILNTELENKRTIFIDGNHFNGEIITRDDIIKCKKEISVTNQLIGG
jgi:hypothetical protein